MYPLDSRLFILSILLFPYNLAASPRCDPWIAKVVSVQGKVDAQFNDSEEWQTIHSNDTLCYGDKVRTSKWARSTVRLYNESVLSLDQNTTLNLKAPKTNKLSWFMQLLNGSVFFRSRESQKLNVETPFINAVHEGTEFLVKVSAENAEIAVFDGVVAGQNPQGRIQIKKGFLGVAGKNQAPTVQALRITPEDAVQWALYYPPLIAVAPDTLSRSPILQSVLTEYQHGDSTSALTKLNEIPLKDQDAQFLSIKAGLLLSVGRVDEASPVIQMLEQSNADPGSAKALKAVIAVSKNQQKTALDLANQAVTLNPNSSVAKIALSYAYQSLFKIEDALQATRSATELAPDNALAWARLAELQLSTGEKEAALSSAQKAQNLNPALAGTQIILGFADLAQSNTDAAQKAFSQAIALDSSDPLARLGLGLVRIRNGELEEGAQELETAVNLDPNNAVIRSYLGKAYYELRNKDYAGKEFEIAKEMDAKDPTAWFYDAILKQTANRPVEALHAMQKAIELNDNRGVYRSSLLLDEDRAVRGTSLGRIYNDLGFEDIATRQATNSLAIDPSNYSAHRLLSDSYVIKPRSELARSSSLLQSQLLQPININPVQPRLAYTDLNIVKGIGPSEIGFNEYNRAFEGNNYRIMATGMYGSNNTLGNEAVFSGIQDKFAYSLGQLHYETNGYRENNDIKHDLYNVFTQYEISPKFNIQSEYRHRETAHGDLELKGSSANFSKDNRRNLDQDTYRFGLKFSPEKRSDLLLSLIYTNRHEINDDYFDIPPFPPLNLTQGYSLGNTQNRGYQLESQYLFRDDLFNVIAGGGTNQFDVNSKTQEPNFGIDLPNCNILKCISTADFKRKQYFGYMYSNINFLNNLTGTVGLSYDSYSSNDPVNRVEINQLSPKFGIKWNYNSHLAFRLAAFQSIKSPIVVNQVIQPIQVAGFNQLFDDINGTKSTQYGMGVDTHVLANLYTGIEAYKRDLEVPVLGEFRKKEEELYRFYLNWIPYANWAVTSEFRFENYRGQKDTPKTVETAYVPLNLRFFNSIGFFTSLGGSYIHQAVKSSSSDEESFKSSFFLVDASIGYRLPKQYGLISLEAKNLLDKNFTFRDRNFQMNENRTSEIIPERTFLARISYIF